MAPNPAGVDGGGGGGGVTRLQMPQVLTVATRPPLAVDAGGSPSTPSTPVAQAAGRVENGGEATDDDDETMAPVVARRARSPVSPGMGGAAARKEGSVQVAIRVRPLLPKEIAARVRTCVETEANTVFIPSNDKTFTFDHVFPMEADQKDLYEQVVQPLMDSFLQGYNVTVLAYGQTGSGKTYTMGNDISTSALAPKLFQRGQPDGTAVDDHEGVIPRFINEMFGRLEDDNNSTTSQVSVSFLEIYGEEIHDLLDQSRGPTRETLQVRESNGSVWVQGLTEVKVSSFAEAAEQMRQGCVRRITGSTGMNEHSSRSHAVYTVKLVRKTKSSGTTATPTTGNVSVLPAKRRGSRRFSPIAASTQAHELLDDDDSETIIVSKLTFVDLAGSERLKKTQAEGDRMKEGIQINVGLLALGNVITALGDERRRSNPRQHVAYRDSKLTRLLQDALGGNSRTLFIACISPAESNAGETVNTLQYASRAKNIQNKAVKNVDPKSAELTRSRVLNDVLRTALAKALSLVSGGFSDARGPGPEALPVDPTVVDFLRKLEEIAWAIASGSSSTAEATMETSKAIASLVGKRSGVTEIESWSSASNESASSRLTDIVCASESGVSLMGPATSETGSSVQGQAYPRSQINLRQACLVLEVIRLILEIKDLQARLADAQATHDAETTRIDTSLAQTSALISVHEEAMKKMGTWDNNHVAPMNFLDRQAAFDQATKRVDLLQGEMETLSRSKAAKTSLFAESTSAIRKELQTKQMQLQQIRRQPNESVSVVEAQNPLDLMIQMTELKDRFRLHELSDVAWALQDDEKIFCEVLDDEPNSLGLHPKFFEDEDIASSQNLLSKIYRIIDTAVADEGLHSSQCKKLRERASILQRIMSGWALDTRSMTEEEFLAANEQDLRTCEENIREISAALRYRGYSSSTMRITIDAIDSVDLAKTVIRRLIDTLYSHKRIILAQEPPSGDTPTQSADKAAIAKLKDQHDQELNALRDKFTADLTAAYDTVKPFALDSLDQEREALYAQRQSDAKTIADLEQRARLKDVELCSMKVEMEKLQNQVESMKSQFDQLKEYAALREECAQLAKELGLPAEDYAGIAAMINPLAIKEAREIRETLLAKKAEKLERIEIAYNRVKSLETVLQTHEPLSIDVIRSSHESVLDDQLLAINFHYTRLAEELSQRVDSHIRVLESIGNLSTEMGVTCLDDIRHAVDELSANDVMSSIDMVDSLRRWRHIRASPDLPIAMGELLSRDESLNDALSGDTLERNNRVMKALLLEKANRLAVLEKIVNEIRSLIEVMEMPEEDVKCILRIFDRQQTDVEPSSVRGISEELLSILRKAGQLDTDKCALERLTSFRETLIEIRDGRSNALSYAHSFLNEAEKIAQDSLASSGVEEFFTPASSECNQVDLEELGCSRKALDIAVNRMRDLSNPTDQAIRALLFASNDQFNAYGIETSTQRISFYLGSEDSMDNPNRKLLERYLGDSSRDEHLADHADADLHRANCFLAKTDPAYVDYARYFSASFGTQRLTNLRDGAGEVRQISRIVMAAQNRLKSLQKIMTDFNAVMAMKKEITEFAANASKKDRLFGSSTVLMKEEKKRKRFAREYPLKLTGLRNEVKKWAENESGDYDLDILGEEMKRLLLDMLNTDTNLMHLDLGVIDPSRQSARRASKTAAGIVAALAPAAGIVQPGHPNQESSPAPAPRVRPGSALARDASGKKRIGGD